MFGLFSSTAKEYRKDLKARGDAMNDLLEDATRKLLHAAGRAMNEPGKPDIFSEYHEGLERRRHARTISN